MISPFTMTALCELVLALVLVVAVPAMALRWGSKDMHRDDDLNFWRG
ncbi:hypothetical protein [Acetobacter oeni]|uniref:Uncharacterized protein n=1 Tax=Acetobacter oeni TaxID=304077 RepID=A0A511XJR4_9PROT|nr:hypothetical protein [Acetobacter oeni]MBB3883401.1 hypothetical protein [Acetobacter oeni]NHO19376.1 hypothetical protein [Acetobacter oeni]GEN63182.1 hypothetical protein AOE01nite_14060 [Acetobacter oeni]